MYRISNILRHHKTLQIYKGDEKMKKSIVVAAVLIALMIASSLAFAEAGKSKIRFGLQYVSPTGDLKESGFEAGPWVYTVYDPDGEPFDVSVSDIDYIATTEADSALGLFFGYEYMVTDMIGIDANLAYSKHDIEHRDEVYGIFDVEGVTGDFSEISTLEGDISMMPITVGVNFHVMQKEKVDLYLGPFLGYVMYGDIKWNKVTAQFSLTPDDPLLDPLAGSFTESASGKTKIKSDFGFGAVVGIDVPFGSGGWMFSSSLKYLSTKAKSDEEYWDAEIDMNPWILSIGVGYTF